METRLRISESRKAQERAKREGMEWARCEGCGDPWRDAKGRVVNRSIKHHVWPDGRVSNLCAFCRDTAKMMGAATLYELLGLGGKEHD